VVFDFTRTSYVTSPGIAVLIKAIKRMQTVSGAVYVFGATQDVKEFLKMSRIDGFLRFM
jgi:anti-anti-sigma regulatory factor